MNGAFRLESFEGDIPCPHCGGTGCAAYLPFPTGLRRACAVTGRIVSDKSLSTSAAKHGNRRVRRVIGANGYAVFRRLGALRMISGEKRYFLRGPDGGNAGNFTNADLALKALLDLLPGRNPAGASTSGFTRDA